jgi:hypothetical protein
MFFKKYSAAIVCGFGVAVLSVIPSTKAVVCCMILPAAAGFSIYLDQKIHKDFSEISLNKALMNGLITGLAAALFVTSIDLLSTYIAKSNDLTESIPQIEQLFESRELGPAGEEAIAYVTSIADEIKTKGFSFVYAFILLFSNLMIYTAFGLLGGTLGRIILNRNIDKT